MLLLLSDDPGTQWTRIATPWITEPVFYPLDHEVLVEVLILEIPDE
jgi:hypothetical protein